MKSKILITLSVLLSFTFLNNEVQAENIQKGITVDIARKSYSLETLKTIVKYIHDHNGQYLQLHFLDDEYYAIESEYFDRKSFSNPYYLTKTEVKSLIEYSNDLNVMVIPDMDFPSHSKAFLSLIKQNDKSLYQEIISDYSDNTLDFFSNRKAVDVTNRQIDEITELFKQPQFSEQQRIVLGGDEVAGGGAHQNSFIEYMNQIGDYAFQQGYEPQMWNDMVMHEGVKSLNYHYSILYWKQNEDNKSNLTVEDFDKYYFDVYNYNYYSLYFLPSKQFSQDDINEQAEYIGWAYAYNKFYYNKSPYNEVNSQNVKGSALSFWGEHATDMTQEELINQEVPLIKAYFNLKK